MYVELINCFCSFPVNGAICILAVSHCKTLQLSRLQPSLSLPGKVPGKVTVDVSQDLHEVGVHGGEGNAGCLSHVDGALLCQVHVVEVDELELGFLLWPVTTEM